MSDTTLAARSLLLLVSCPLAMGVLWEERVTERTSFDEACGVGEMNWLVFFLSSR